MKDCELIQLEISDKFDSNVQLNASEMQHLSCCEDCSNFHQFLQGEALNTLAKTEVALEPIKGVTAWKKIVQFVPFAAAAGIAISMVVDKSEPTNTPQPVAVNTPAGTSGDNIVAAKLNQISDLKNKVNLKSNYQRISNVAADNWDLVTENISNAKTFISEKPIFRVLFSDNETPQTSNGVSMNNSV